LLKKQNFLEYQNLLSDQGHLKAVVFATKGMISMYHFYKDMIILDTTFGLYRFNMPLLTLSGVKNNGVTVILGFAMLLDETFELKEWVLKNFLAFVKEPPIAAISDACPALTKALKQMFEPTKLFLCAWHVQLNLKRYFSGAKKSF